MSAEETVAIRSLSPVSIVKTEGARSSKHSSSIAIVVGNKRLNLKVVKGDGSDSTSRGGGSTSATGGSYLDGGYMCMYCGICLPTADEVANHEAICSSGDGGEGSFSCQTCGKLFSSFDELGLHQRVHEMSNSANSSGLISPVAGYGEHFCHYCDKEFSSANALSMHEAMHDADGGTGKVFKCEECDMVFPRKLDLLAHARVHSENPQSCVYCGKEFHDYSKLQAHEMQHIGKKPYQCSYCDKDFSQKAALQLHERIHTGEKPFQCPICTKCFARQTNYNCHMKLHASGRRFFCSYCGKWFRTDHEMQDHESICLLVQNGQWPDPVRNKILRYRCGYCDRLFAYRRDVTIHERKHTGERPYTCGYCGKGFSQSQALTVHIRTHTGEKPYVCVYCAKDFRDSSALRKHEFLMHTEDVPIEWTPDGQQGAEGEGEEAGTSNAQETETRA